MNFVYGIYTMAAVCTLDAVIDRWNAYKLRKKLKEFLDDD